MAARQLPDPELLRKLLRYELETGKLYWLPRTPDMFASHPTYSIEIACRVWNARFSGREAFITKHTHGYLYGRIVHETHLAHRVIWAIHTGKRDFQHIDHLNGVKTDNRIINLRCVDQSVNMRNAKLRKDNVSGIVGVRLIRNPKTGTQRWLARIYVNGRTIALGSFVSKSRAIDARRDAEKRFGFGPNHGT